MAIPFPEEAITETVGDCVICQFGLDPEGFEFGVGNLAGPEFPGIANLIASVIVAFIEALLTFADPVLYILDAKIVDLLDWIGTATSDPIQFLGQIIQEKIIDPIVSKLQVWLPPFTIELEGFPAIEVDESNPDLREEWDTPQWVAQIDGFVGFLIALIKLPVNIILEVFASIVNELTIPTIGQPLLEKVWEAIVPSFGFPPGSPMEESVTTFGICFLDKLTSFIPPPFPSEGGQSPPQADNLIEVSVVGGPTISGKGIVYFNKVAETKQIKIKRTTSEDVEITEIKAQSGAGGQIHFTFNGSPIELTDDVPEVTVPLTYDGFNPTGPEIGNMIIKIGEDEDTKVFTFQAQSYEKSLIDMLKDEIEAAGGEWHPEINIFGIRREHSSVNTFQDIIGVAAYSTGTNQFNIYAWKATTRPGRPFTVQYADTAAGCSNIYPGHYSNIWAVWTHTPPATPAGSKNQFPALVQKFPGKFKVFLDKDKNGKPKPNYIKFETQSLNCHRADPNYVGNSSEQIGRWSAGCQVFQIKSEHEEFMRILMSSQMFTNGGLAFSPNETKFNYTLFLKEKVPELWDGINETFNLYPS